jgi:hypothetical protein
MRASGLSWPCVKRIPERGARLARRDDREYREYLREEQRRQAGCPARKALYRWPGQATSVRVLYTGGGRPRPAANRGVMQLLSVLRSTCE